MKITLKQVIIQFVDENGNVYLMNKTVSDKHIISLLDKLLGGIELIKLPNNFTIEDLDTKDLGKFVPEIKE
jgi:hypothetical protein